MSSLHLDRDNPRLVEYGITASSSEFDVLKILWEKMNIEELAMSIAYNGYFEHEPLFVEMIKGKAVVIEGNRRLAAVKVLIDDDLRAKLKIDDIPRLKAKEKDALQTLPCLDATRKELWRYLGFKHVNGPSAWGAYAKAQYIARVHHDYGVSLADIAKQIGDYNSTVERWYRGLMVIEQAEKEKVFDRDNIDKPEFYFNYIYTALDYPGFQRFLGLSPKMRDSATPVPSNKLKHLGEVCLWLYGMNSPQTKSLIKSQNPDLKTLDAVLADEKGVKALRDGLPLDVAMDISVGDERLFRKALQDGKQALQRAHGTLSTGFKPGDNDAVKTATEIRALAGDLVDEMKQKQPKTSGRSGRVD